MKEKHSKETKIVEDNELVKLLNGEYHIPAQATRILPGIIKKKETRKGA